MNKVMDLNALIKASEINTACTKAYKAITNAFGYTANSTLTNRLPVSSVIYAAILFVCSTGLARATDYLVDVVVFENMAAARSVSPGPLYYPKLTSAMGLTSDRAASSGFELVEDGLSLAEEAEKIRQSGSYRLLRHFAWRQPGLDNQSSKPIRVNLGRTLPVYISENISAYDKYIPASTQPTGDKTRQLNTTTVNGSLNVRLGRFLHMDVQLVFTDIENSRSYRLTQSRKLRSREYHYIDNERFGLLVRILPIEGT